MIQHGVSFRLAFEGIKYALKSQINFKIHGLIALIVLFLGWLEKITYFEWIAIIISIIIVLSAEMTNTAIESMTDLITEEYKKQAKIAKDVSAGMVLTTAIGAAIVGFIIFAPKIFV